MVYPLCGGAHYSWCVEKDRSEVSKIISWGTEAAGTVQGYDKKGNGQAVGRNKKGNGKRRKIRNGCISLRGKKWKKNA